MLFRDITRQFVVQLDVQRLVVLVDLIGGGSHSALLGDIALGGLVGDGQHGGRDLGRGDCFPGLIGNYGFLHDFIADDFATFRHGLSALRQHFLSDLNFTRIVECETFTVLDIFRHDLLDRDGGFAVCVLDLSDGGGGLAVCRRVRPGLVILGKVLNVLADQLILVHGPQIDGAFQGALAFAGRIPGRLLLQGHIFSQIAISGIEGRLDRRIGRRELTGIGIGVRTGVGIGIRGSHVLPTVLFVGGRSPHGIVLTQLGLTLRNLEILLSSLGDGLLALGRGGGAGDTCRVRTFGLGDGLDALDLDVAVAFVHVLGRGVIILGLDLVFPLGLGAVLDRRLTRGDFLVTAELARIGPGVAIRGQRSKVYQSQAHGQRQEKA